MISPRCVAGENGGVMSVGAPHKRVRFLGKSGLSRMSLPGRTKTMGIRLLKV